MATPEETARAFLETKLYGAADENAAIAVIAGLIRSVQLEERQMSVTVCSNYNFFKNREGGAESPDVSNLTDTFRAMLAELPAPSDGVK